MILGDDCTNFASQCVSADNKYMDYVASINKKRERCKYVKNKI